MHSICKSFQQSRAKTKAWLEVCKMCQLETITALCVLMLIFLTDAVLPQPITEIPVTGFYSISNSSRRYLNHELDGISDPIYIPYGFAFGEETFTKAYVGTNGVISFGRPFHLWHPRQFPSNDPLVNSANVLAPYWSDNDIRNSGEVFYGEFQYADSAEGDNFLVVISSLISSSYPNASNFRGNFIIIAEWNEVHPFPHGSSNLTNILSNNPSVSDFIEMTNTYQAVAITDGTDSYAIFTYDCNLLQWTGLWNQPVIGFNAANGSLYSNHPYSSLNNANEIACIYNEVSNYTSVIFKISSAPSEIQIQRQSCWRWYFNDISLRALNFYYRFVPPCPCTEFQAWFDLRWNFYFQTPIRICYISRILPIELGHLCCYYTYSPFVGAPIVSGQYSGGFLLYHPHADYSRYRIYDLIPKSLCCSVGLCNIFQQKRPFQTCENYQLQQLGWAWGDPHFTTIDGRTYTFNGLGEYVLLRIDALDFEIQGRATRLVNESNATVFTALAFGIINTDDIVQIKVSNNPSWLNVTVKNESVPPNFILRRIDTDYATVAFDNDIGVTVELYAGYLNIEVQLPPRYMELTMGLLGNYNENASDEFIFRNGTVLDDSGSDRAIHQFAQSWQLQDNIESLFFYDDGEDFSTYADPDHRPPFLDEIANELLANTQLNNTCGSNLQCLFDYNQTGNSSIGLFAAGFQQRLEYYEILYSTFSPIVSAPQVLFGMVGSESNYAFSVISSTGIAAVAIAINETVRNTNDSLPSNMKLVQVNSTTLSLLWTPLHRYETFTLDLIRFVLLGNSEPIALSRFLITPQVQLCDCQNGGTCTTDGVLQYDQNFILLQCLCLTGYGGEFCEEVIDDCDLLSCLDGAECISDVGCPCPNGYLTFDSKCIDIDECAADNGPCQQVCTNTPGSYQCSCFPGYFHNNTNKTCEDINECVDTYHGCHHDCQNTIGSYVCTCYDGFILAEDERSCEVGENFTCEPETDNCSQLCVNISSEINCSCELGYELQADGTNCSDVDECDQQLAPCNQVCNNTDGSFICSCNDGYYLGDDMLTCYDINECMMPAQYSCPNGMVCSNVEGTYDCVCPSGTILNNRTECVLHVITEQSIATSVPSTTTFSSPSMTSSLPTSTVSADSEASDGLPTGAIVGIAVGVVLALGAVLIIIGGIAAYYKFSHSKVCPQPEKLQ